MAVKSVEELQQNYITELQSQAPELTDLNDGSNIDIISGTTALGVSEVSQLIIEEFRKLFFTTANGPEVTGGADDLQYLAVDRYGDAFARPGATKSTGTVTFARPNTIAGNVAIGVGAIVKTAPNSNGETQRFEVTAAVTMTGTTISASVRAIVGGTAGNVTAGTVKVIETTLTDPTVTVNNIGSFAGGAETEDDSTYRETIRDLIETLRGATLAAIEAEARSVAGVEKATGSEFIQQVREWDVPGGISIGATFQIPRVKLYIADANGTASGALVQDVKDAIAVTRAAGVFVDVIAAVAFILNWTATLTLNPSGPNYATLLADTTMIKNYMIKYLQELPIGTSFDRNIARLYIMTAWGPTGTNDLTDFVTSVPSGNIALAGNEKIVPGVIST